MGDEVTQMYNGNLARSITQAGEVHMQAFIAQLIGACTDAERAELFKPYLTDSMTYTYAPYARAMCGIQGVSLSVAEGSFYAGAPAVYVLIGKRIAFTNMAQFMEWAKENGHV